MHRTITQSKARWRLVVAALITAAALVLVAGCSGSLPTAGNVNNSDAKTLADKGVRIVDVRTVAEFEGGHIPDAENVPLDQLEASMASWDPAERVLVYCATGSRSVEAMRILSAAGFSTVYNLTSGIVAWDGEITTDPTGRVASGGPSTPSASGLPVMYEFYTDW